MLALGSGMSRLLKSIPQEMVAENLLGRPEGKLVRFNLMAITGVLYMTKDVVKLLKVHSTHTRFCAHL